MGQTVYKYKKGGFTSVDLKSPIIAEGLRLQQNYPNPFNPETIISFSVPFKTEPNQLIQLKVYDVLGKEVTTLVNEVKEPGEYSVLFDARGLSSGVYYYTLRSGNETTSKKLVLIK